MCRLKTSPTWEAAVNERLLLDIYDALCTMVEFDAAGAMPLAEVDQTTVAVLQKLHPCMLDRYTPLQVAGDGNCGPRAVSLALFSSVLGSKAIVTRSLPQTALWLYCSRRPREKKWIKSHDGDPTERKHNIRLISLLNCWYVNWCSAYNNVTSRHTHAFNGLFTRTTGVSRHQKGKFYHSGFYWSKRSRGGSGISWMICTSFAQDWKHITTPVSHQSICLRARCSSYYVCLSGLSM